MTSNDAHLYLPAVEALRDKELQWLNPSTGKWQDTDCAGFEYTPDCYRRRPKPREWNVFVYSDGSMRSIIPAIDGKGHKFIRVREVIE